MKKKQTIEQKIKTYLRSGFFDRKPRLTTPQVVEYANSKGADWSVLEVSDWKYSGSSENNYFTSGGSREYKGYSVIRDGRVIYNSTETYRKIGDLLRELPNYEELK